MKTKYYPARLFLHSRGRERLFHHGMTYVESLGALDFVTHIPYLDLVPLSSKLFTCMSSFSKILKHGLSFNNNYGISNVGEVFIFFSSPLVFFFLKNIHTRFLWKRTSGNKSGNQNPGEKEKNVEKNENS